MKVFFDICLKYQTDADIISKQENLETVQEQEDMFDIGMPR